MNRHVFVKYSVYLFCHQTVGAYAPWTSFLSAWLVWLSGKKNKDIFCFKHNTLLNFSSLQTRFITDSFANSLDTDKMAYNESSHQDLRLPFYY